MDVNRYTEKLWANFSVWYSTRLPGSIYIFFVVVLNVRFEIHGLGFDFVYVVLD